MSLFLYKIRSPVEIYRVNSTPQQPRVFVIGSSLTIQFGPFLEKELEGRFHYDRKRDSGNARAEDNLDIPQGASGGDSSMVLAYVKERRKADPIAADILLLSCGLHDIKTDRVSGSKQVSLGQFKANLKEILEEAAGMGLKVAWLRITPVVDEIHNARSKNFSRFSADVDSYNAVADEVVQNHGVTSIDLHALCLTQMPHALIDHVHYDEEARKKQAAFIAAELSKHF